MIESRTITTGLTPSPAGWHAWVSFAEDDGTVSHTGHPLVGHLELTEEDDDEEVYRWHEPCWYEPDAADLTHPSQYGRPGAEAITITGPDEGLPTALAESRALEKARLWDALHATPTPAEQYAASHG